MPQGVFSPDDDFQRDTRSIAISLVEMDAEWCCRCSPVDARVVAELHRVFQRRLFVPPIVVAKIGKGTQRRFVCVDGRARLEAATRAGAGDILAEIYADPFAALWVAIGQNSRPCQIRTPADSRRSAELARRIRPNLSRADLARHANVGTEAIMDAG